MPTNRPWAMCSFPLLAIPRGMSEFISSEYTSPITRRRKAATRAAKPIIKIAEPMSMVLLVCSAKGESLGVNVLSTYFQPLTTPPTSTSNSFWPWSHLMICLAACCPGEKIIIFFNIFYGCLVKVITCFPKTPTCFMLIEQFFFLFLVHFNRK